MQAMSLQQLAHIVSGQSVGADVMFAAVSSDTRSIKKGELFVALQGENFDANSFVEQASKKGAAAALVSADITADLPYVKVSDTLAGLTALAKQQREVAGIPLVAITGSNGKTSVKEMLASILTQSKNVLATEGNLNNQIGVPLTLLKLTADHDIAVVEMGASHRGDIAELCDIAKPTVAILNNVGAAHLEGFGDLQGVADTKGEIISGLSSKGIAILNKDEPWFDQWSALPGDRKVISFGSSNVADVWADLDVVDMGLVGDKFTTNFVLNYGQESIDIRLSLLGKHNVLNALAAAGAAISLGVSLQEIQKGLVALKPVKGRMQPLKGVAGGLIINDCYNANPKSFDVAVECLSEIDRPVCLVLGDFAELGADSVQIHKDLGDTVFNSDVRCLCAVGEKMKFAVDRFNALAQSTTRYAKHFFNKQALTDYLTSELSANDVVLVKASRSQGLESVVEEITIKEGVICC
ncbi:MAG: UDP-N-acetylmuramoyl-tripeptide--D-alanyl-D-alanine ligase [Cycloclasticus sp. symbiont of Bathymodiolus heckerae]|nr:MAG: UDP-N-acetylmuramoyl-tripeptide--D-alanyl-D-alanine ligase [Cycloclasticus sp. symbiont of Bathymodiolus heckerae]